MPTSATYRCLRTPEILRWLFCKGRPVDASLNLWRPSWEEMIVRVTKCLKYKVSRNFGQEVPRRSGLQ